MSDRCVAVLSGGLSHERDVSLRSGRRLSAALRSAGVTVEEWDADASLLARLRDQRPDAVVVALHGGEGEGGSIQTVLEMLDVPYVGADSHACRRAWDKPTAKTELVRAGLATPEWVVLPHSTFRELGAQPVLTAMVDRLGLPMMLKPEQGGSALGAQVVRDAAELPAAMVGCLAYSETVLAERFVEGVEVAVTVIDGPDGPEALPAVEIVPETRRLRLHRPLHRRADDVPHAGPARRARGSRGRRARGGGAPAARTARRVADRRDRRGRRDGLLPGGQLLAGADRDLAPADGDRGRRPLARRHLRRSDRASGRPHSVVDRALSAFVTVT